MANAKLSSKTGEVASPKGGEPRVLRAKTSRGLARAEAHRVRRERSVLGRVPLGQFNSWHEWIATVADRVRPRGCPHCYRESWRRGRPRRLNRRSTDGAAAVRALGRR